MGLERVLQAAAAAVIVLATPAAFGGEKVAILDLGPSDAGAARAQIAKAVSAAKLVNLAGDGIEDALAGQGAERDTLLLADAMTEAKHAFGELDCTAATAAAQTAARIAAARQAGGLAVPELPRAWAYVLLCADRAGLVDRAMLAASRLRAAGGSPDVPADILARYPDVDVMGGHELIDLDIASDVGAAVWIDHQRAGIAPLHVVLPAGAHVIAVARATKRAAQVVDVGRGTSTITIATEETTATWSAVARRVASWHGKVPAPQELAWVLTRVAARVAIVRYGQTIEVWGQVGKSELPHRMGAEDGVGTLGDAPRLAGLIVDRVQAWNDHAPDPDQPLLVDAGPRDASRADEPTKWWVYATILGAIAAGGIAVYAHDSAKDTQHIELHYP